MAKRKINDKFLQEFFGIDDTDEGKEELAKINEGLERLVYENGQDIMKIDDEPDGVYFLESGTALVFNRDGEQINIMHEGQYFGEYAVLAKQRRLSTVRSLGKTVVYRLGCDETLAILSKRPEIYGELMKHVYGQVSGKHSQILALAGMRKGILQHPSNQAPLTKKQVLCQYGSLILIYILSAFLIPKDTSAPVFILPLALMLSYVLITKRTVESLLASIVLASILIYRTGISAGLADSLMETMGNADNVFTVLVMALIGGMVRLIEESGAITAFRKFAGKVIKSKRGTFFTSYGIMAATCIDDGLNMLCASSATNSEAKEQKIPREKLSLIYSMLPTVLSSFIPLSLWGIFVIGTLNASAQENAVKLFCKSIPFNFFSIIVVILMFFFCAGKLPLCRQLKDADKRVDEGGTLWPHGSERYLSLHEPEMWGKALNVMLPIVVLAIFSLAVRSILAGTFVVDSAVGLIATLIFMLLLYCWQGLMTPEQFVEHLVEGMESSVLPIILYLLTMCFAMLLEKLSLTAYFLDVVEIPRVLAPLFPAVLFLMSMLLTVALGSSWAMYAIVFPIAVSFAPVLGMSLPLCVGAIAGAGIAGEKNCMFTADALNVGTAIGCNPAAVRSVRMKYSIVITCITAGMYLIAGIINVLL